MSTKVALNNFKPLKTFVNLSPTFVDTFVDIRRHLSTEVQLARKSQLNLIVRKFFAIVRLGSSGACGGATNVDYRRKGWLRLAGCRDRKSNEPVTAPEPQARIHAMRTPIDVEARMLCDGELRTASDFWPPVAHARWATTHCPSLQQQGLTIGSIDPARI